MIFELVLTLIKHLYRINTVNFSLANRTTGEQYLKEIIQLKQPRI